MKKSVANLVIILLALGITSCSSYQGDSLMADEVYMTKNERNVKTNQLRNSSAMPLATNNIQQRSSSNDAFMGDEFDYYDGGLNARNNRLWTPRTSMSPYHDPFMFRQPGLSFGMGMGFNSFGPMGYHGSLCFNCYDPFWGPSWLPMGHLMGFGATSFYDPFWNPYRDPFFMNSFRNPMWGFYNPYAFMPTTIMPRGRETQNIIRSNQNPARNQSNRLSRSNYSSNPARSGGNSASQPSYNRSSGGQVIRGTDRNSSRNYSPNRTNNFQRSAPNISPRSSSSPSRSISSPSASPSRSFSSPSGGSRSSGSSRPSGGSRR